jgi:hypothetical protein
MPKQITAVLTISVFAYGNIAVINSIIFSNIIKNLNN